MARVKAQLNRNLRRQILRGHPWIYKQAVNLKGHESGAVLAEVSDQKGKFLAWALYDDSSPLALRVLSLEKKPPTESYFRNLIELSISRRNFLDKTKTTGFRLINGEGDRLPGLVCDIYNDTAVVQFDGDGAKKYWDQYPVVDWITEAFSCQSVVNKTRGTYELIKGSEPQPKTIIQENGLKFAIDIVNGQKTGFFLDQRDNREYIKSMSAGKSVMNLFSYTGGFSIYAGSGGAKKVLSVDLAKPALELAKVSWKLNGLAPDRHSIEAVDVFDFMENDLELWDMVIVDPPSMAHSEKQRELAISKYISIFAKAARKVAPGGHLVLSSCSSHVSFEDFFNIIAESLSESTRRGLIQRVSGQGADHPFPHICPELRYLKFVHLHLE